MFHCETVQTSKWSPDQCRVLGNRQSRGPYPSCEGWWYSPLWSGSLRKYVSWRSHVCPYQDLALLVLESWSNSAKSAFRKLDQLYGTWCKPSTLKVD